jgi:sulfide:quinone oxidoreductase
MSFMTISDEISLAGQLDEASISKAIAAGFRTIICNRPDEEDGALAHANLQHIAESAGVAFHYHPVASAHQSDGEARQMAELIGAAEKPILAYCRSGARSGRLYEMAMAYL